MKILGINGGRAAPLRVDPSNLRPLSDGAAALLSDGKIACATIEERHTRKRYAGGFQQSGIACLHDAATTPDRLDAVGHSTCCDVRWTREADIIDDIVESWRSHYTPEYLTSALRGRVYSVDHHESHAFLAFAGSGFRRALVCVMDGLGNRYDEPDQFHIQPDWWRGAFERHDFYIAEWVNDRVHLTKVHEDACGLDEIGIGEIYRGVTHYLGWPSYQYAGKTMALAAHGDPRALSDVTFVDFRPPHGISVPTPNLHASPTEQIRQVLAEANHVEPAGLSRPAGPAARFFCDVAARLQEQVEKAIIATVSALAERFEVQSICFGGGVAMNCVALGKLAAHRPDLRLYVPPAPADTGQALGNALWLAYSNRSPIAETNTARPLRSAGLGPRYGDKRLALAVESFGAQHTELDIKECDSNSKLVSLIVDRLTAQKVIGLRFGRAEYGPRALGFASIIADARQREMHDTMVKVKRREPFRPYAPSILQERVADYFDISIPSPFMSFAGTVREEKRSRIPAVVHIDGTARYHSVARDRGIYRRVLEEFCQRTRVPVIMNTSFNVNGEPIVESPEDTLDCFYRSGIHSLAIGKWIIDRN